MGSGLIDCFTFGWKRLAVVYFLFRFRRLNLLREFILSHEEIIGCAIVGRYGVFTLHDCFRQPYRGHIVRRTLFDGLPE